jgi:hypothetical protein
MKSLSIVIAVTLLASCSGIGGTGYNHPNSENPFDRNGPFYESLVY